MITVITNLYVISVHWKAIENFVASEQKNLIPIRVSISENQIIDVLIIIKVYNAMKVIRKI